MKTMELEYYPVGTKLYRVGHDGHLLSYFISMVRSEIVINEDGIPRITLLYSINDDCRYIERINAKDINRKYFLDYKDLLNNLVSDL